MTPSLDRAPIPHIPAYSCHGVFADRSQYFYFESPRIQLHAAVFISPHFSTLARKQERSRCFGWFRIYIASHLSYMV